ncbi:MAG: hypothetical protein DCC55_35780, partial [Chloroflexi bacterium]
MSNHRTKYFKLLTVCIVLIQIFTVTTAGALTALQPTPQMAQAAAADLGLGHFLGESFAGLAWGAQQIFGAPKTALAQAPTASADIQFSTGGGSFADDVTVLPGTTILVRINYDNTGDLNGSAASITSALPAGFSLVPGSTVNCLNPTATELVCNTDAGQGGAIDEGAVWAGSNLTIAPTAGLYGEPVGTTSGVLATGRKAYFNLHHCHYQESTEAGFTDDLIHYWAPNASGPNGTWADTNISNTQDTSVRCATPSGSYVFAGPPVVTNFELLGKRYLNWHHCHYQEINNQPAIGDDLVFYGANPTWTGTNTSNTADASATCTNAFAATYTQVGQVVHNLDLLNNRYLNLHYCPYVDTSQGVVDDAYYFLGSPNDPSITTNTSLTPDVSAACNSAPPGPGDWHQAGGAVNPMDYLDTARGKGFIAFQMVATSTPGAYPQAADLSGGNFSTANDSGTITVQATAVVPSVDKKFYGGTTPSGDDNVTVPQGATFTERIFFDNTGNIAGTATSVTAAVPAGFALVAGSTKVCLTPSDTEQVCNTDAGQGGAINEGAVWSGQNLTISPSAGLFGESTGATSGVLEMGKKRYLNLHECKFSSPSDQFWMINPNAGGFFAGTNVANTADASPNCGGGTGSYPLGNLASVANLDLLGRRYLNLHECNYSSGTEQFWSNSPTAGPYAAGTNTSNTVDATASCQAGSEYPHTGLAAVAELDLLNNRYLNLHECKYSGPTDQFWSSNPKLGSFAAGTNTANTQDASPNCANGTGSYPFTNSAVVASLDLLDATRGKGYVEFQLVANAAVGSYVQTAGISGAEFSALSDNGTITVVASAPVPSVDKQFSNDGTTFANSITVPQGATITERIYYNNSGNEAGVGSTISATIPTGFSLVAGSTKNCLNPTAGETVCNTDAGQGGAINEGAVWSGQTLNIAPTAGLYGASSSDTSGRLETGRKRYFNLHECQYLNPSAEDFFTNVGYGPYVAGTNVSNTQDGLANCGGGDATWTNNAKSVRPLDLLGRRYLNLHECQYNTAVPNDVFFTLGGGDGGPTYATGTNTSNTEDTDATCGPGNAGGSPQTKVWRPLDLQDKRYLNLVECQYLNSSINDNFFTNVGYSPYDTSTSATSSQPSGPSCTGGG